MKTEIIKIDSNNPEEDKLIYCSEILKNGGIVAFPTETVYGLGANVFNANAVQKIFTAKGRPNDNPLIVHISSKSDLVNVVSNIPTDYQLFTEKFWPGPLTLVFDKHPNLPNIALANLSSVGVRQPDHPIALGLIKHSGPLAAPSANISGKPSPTASDHVIEDLAGKIDCIIDGGTTRHGLESTVFDIRQNKILRLGAITESQLSSVTNVSVKLNLTKEEIKKPISPGQKYKHYAIDSPTTLVIGEQMATVKKILELTQNKNNVGILTTNSSLNYYNNSSAIVVSLGYEKNPHELAQNLYVTLRKFDKLKVTHLFIEGLLQKNDLYLSLMDRLIKAASYNILTV